MKIIDAHGNPLTLALMNRAFAEAWRGRDAPKRIHAEHQTLQYALYKVGQRHYPGTPIRFNGAYFVEDPTCEKGTIVFDVPDRQELNVKLINVLVEPVPPTCEFRPLGPEDLDVHTIALPVEIWNELWNSLPAVDRFMNSQTDGFAMLLITPVGRRLRIVRKAN